MATGYVVSGRGDLDTLFKARTSAAGANTGFKSNGGVDLAQRFEPRGSSPAIAATNFKSGSTDLAQLFKDISVTSETFTDHTMVARATIPTPDPDAYRGFDDGVVTGSAIASATISPGTLASWTISALACTTNTPVQFALRGASAPNNDATWKRIEVTGVMESGGSSGTYIIHRSSAAYLSGTAGGLPYGYWSWTSASGTVMNFVPGNSYAVRIYRG